MNRSEHFVAMILVFVLYVVALSLMEPRTVVVSSVNVAQLRRVASVQPAVFSVRCELGGRVFSIEYGAKREE